MTFFPDSAMEISPDDIARRLAAAGVEGAPAQATRLQFGKIAVRLRDGAGFAKLAHGPFATALARREAAAYQADPPPPPFIRPALRGFHDAGDWAALWFSWMDGAPEPAWRALIPRRSPFDGETPVIHPLSAVLAEMAPETDAPSIFAAPRRALLARDGDRPVACRRAHGDFIYWNVLRRCNAPPAIIDFEHSLAIAPHGHDRLYWTATPLLRSAAVANSDRIAAWAMRRLVRHLVAPHLVATFLIHLGARLEQEQAAAARLGEAQSPQSQRRTRLLTLLERLTPEVI